MGGNGRILKTGVQVVFYLLVLALLLSNSVAASISHDENQFIAPGQFLAYDGLLPYVDYPYTHMPYAIPFYAISALASDFDLLAGRALSSLAWLGCILLMVQLARALHRGNSESNDRTPSWGQLAWEFLLVYVFINHGTALFVLRTALNHSLATLFSLLAAWFFVVGTRRGHLRYGFLSGACAAAAGLTRFNFASLTPVLLVCWLIYSAWLGGPQPKRLMLTYAGGLLAASVPAVALAVLAPRAFYYGNIVYIRLNTVYYESLLHRAGMDLASKLGGFVHDILLQPLDLMLYGLLVVTSVFSLLQLIRHKSRQCLAVLTIAASAVTLWLTALAPTPTLPHYFAAPVPFLFVLLLGSRIRERRLAVPARLLGVALIAAAATISIQLRNPVEALASLARPSGWPAVQLHETALGLREFVDGGTVLTLQPMVPLEAGLGAYPFTATGPFSWRTSALLTEARRLEYGVTSPSELPALLEEQAPAGILVGFEAPNPGFERQDMGGLETPFSDYAELHGYRREAITLAYWPRGLTLWVRP